MSSRIAWWILTILSAGIILGFSCQTGEQSGQLSQSLTSSLLDNWDWFSTLPLDQQVEVLAQWNAMLRSVAHIVIFSVLGFCFTMLTNTYPLSHPVVVALLGCSMFAVVDESVQLFLQAGRTFQFVDLLKDWLGVLCGVGIAMLIQQNKNRKKQEG